jgi:hypothetical protein
MWRGFSSGSEGKGILPLYLVNEVRAEVTALSFSGAPLMTYSVEVDLNSANSLPSAAHLISIFYSY